MHWKLSLHFDHDTSCSPVTKEDQQWHHTVLSPHTDISFRVLHTVHEQFVLAKQKSCSLDLICNPKWKRLIWWWFSAYILSMSNNSKSSVPLNICLSLNNIQYSISIMGRAPDLLADSSRFVPSSGYIFLTTILEFEHGCDL